MHKKQSNTSSKFLGIISIFATYVILETDAFAMHISEGILPLGWAAFWYILMIPFLAYGIVEIRRRVKMELYLKPLLGLSASLVFVISLMPIPVPIAGTCSHPCGTAISAIILGPFLSVVVSFCALLIQALFLAHGGLSTLGSNTLLMGVAGSFFGYGAFVMLKRFRLSLPLCGFVAGIVADWATYSATAVQLALGIKGEEAFFPLFLKILVAFVPTQLPLGLLEGFITSGVITLLLRRRPDLMGMIYGVRSQEVEA